MAGITYYENEIPTYTCTLTDGTIDQYPRAIVYNSDGTAKENVDLSHVANGQYTGAAADTYNKGYYMVTYIVYSDSGHTTPNTDYWYGEDILDVAYKPIGGYGGGGTPEIDWKKLIDRIWEHKTPEKILEKIEKIKNAVSKITNNKVIQAIKNITFPPFPEIPEVVIPPFPEMPKPEKVDLTPITEQVKIETEKIISTILEIPKYSDDNVMNKLKLTDYGRTFSRIVKMLEEINKRDYNLELYNILEKLKKNEDILNNLKELKNLFKKYGNKNK